MQANKPLIAVIGDGVAAHVSVLALKQQGLRSVLIHNEREPRYPSWPESIDANGIDLLSQLIDTHELLRKCQYPLELKHSCWGSDLLVTSLNRRLNQSSHLTHVINKQYLLEYLGDEVMKASRIEIGPVCSVRNHDGAIILKTANGVGVNCDAVIFAWGKDPILNALSQTVKTDTLHGRHWILKNLSCTELDDEAFSIVEACRYGWWYGVSLPSNSMSLLFMTDPERQHVQNKSADFLVDNLNHTLHLKSCIYERGLNQLCRSDQFNHLCCHRTTFSGSFSSPRGPLWFAVGDAAMSLDPLSSFGLTCAIWSAILAAKRIKQCFQGEFIDASRAYQNDMQQFYRTIVSKRTEVYGEEKRFKGEFFWAKRQLAA